MKDEQEPKKKLGVIGNQKRFDKNSKERSPGPGDYRLEMYSSLSKGQLSIMAPVGAAFSPRSIRSLSPFSMNYNSLNKTSRF